MDRRTFLQSCGAVALSKSASARIAFDVDSFDRARVLKAAVSFLAEAPLTITAARSPRSAGGLHDFTGLGALETVSGTMTVASNPQLRSFTGLNLAREDQFEIFVELTQNIYAVMDRNGRQKSAIDSAGRFAFINKPDGWIFAVSGGFYY